MFLAKVAMKVIQYPLRGGNNNVFLCSMEHLEHESLGFLPK